MHLSPIKSHRPGSLIIWPYIGDGLSQYYIFRIESGYLFNDSSLIILQQLIPMSQVRAFQKGSCAKR